MRLKGLLAALAALAVLGGLAWWSNRSGGGEPKQAEEPSPKILEVNEAEVTRLEIRRKDGETTVIERTPEAGWEITAPGKYEADLEGVLIFMAAVTSVNADKLVDEKTAGFAPYGLKEPALEFHFTLTKNRAKTLMVGDEAPGSGNFYARVAGEQKLYTIASFTKAAIDKRAAELRDARLARIDPPSLTRIELVSKNGTVEFGRNARGEWQIVKPSMMRADLSQVEEAVKNLSGAKMDPLAGEDVLKRNEAAFGAAPLYAKATLAAGATVAAIEIRKAGDQYLARSSAVEGVHALAAQAVQRLDRSADAFRAKKVFDFGFNEPSRVEYKDGKVSRDLSKSGEKWSEGGKTMDSIGVQSLIDRLRGLTASGFPTSAPAEAKVTIAVHSTGGKVVERVSIAQQGERYFARREGEAAIYQVEPSDVEELSQAAADVKPSQPSPPAKK